MLLDGYGRQIDYLHIAVTDRCSLDCCHCMPAFSRRPHLPQVNILSYEELYRLAEAAAAAGISKIRISGGEPLERKGVVDFCAMLGSLSGIENLALTTNGVSLSKMARPLKKAGVNRINVSLNTLKYDRFETITGRDRLFEVISGIRQAERAGFYPIKINTAVMRGINDDEVGRIAELTYDHPYHVRFIELMPFEKRRCGHYRDLYMPIGEIIERIPRIDAAQTGPTLIASGPAQTCRLPGAKGKIGFIAPLSWNFCARCNRLRITADGKIRPCLCSETEIDVKTPLRNGATKGDLVTLFHQAIDVKPRRHCLSRPARAGRQVNAGQAVCASV